MPNTTQIEKVKASTKLQPWSCIHQPDKSQVAVYNKTTGKYEIIFETRATASHSAETIAEFVTRTVNSLIQRETVINEMRAALELCLECDGLSWAAEHDADIALRLAKKRQQ